MLHHDMDIERIVNANSFGIVSLVALTRSLFEIRVLQGFFTNTYNKPQP
jgi:hypothetical protein